MLFSDKQIASFINDNFEPVWVSVRPVPTIKVDFGNGNVLTRTLHGNIATYACDSYGKVLDVLPGIYTPEEYQKGLRELSMLSKYLRRPDGSTIAAKWQEYHSRQAKRLSEGVAPAVLVEERMPDLSKAGIERGTKQIFLRDPNPYVRTSNPSKSTLAMATVSIYPSATQKVSSVGVVTSPASYKSGSSKTDQLVEALRKDSALNESERRLIIHQKLIATGQTQPVAIMKWLYREVLHADLDDPYLGLGPVLFAAYPFKEEDRAAH